MLDMDELLELEEVIRGELEDNLEMILVKLNRLDKLNELMALLGLSNYLGETDIEVARGGKIIVIGESEVEKKTLEGVAKQYGIEKDRFEFYLNYKDAKTFDFRKTQWSSRYSCILVGQMPHSGLAKGDYGSIISALEAQDGYPPVVRMGLNGLKITKSSFRNTLEYLVSEQKIA